MPHPINRRCAGERAGDLAEDERQDPVSGKVSEDSHCDRNSRIEVRPRYRPRYVDAKRHREPPHHRDSPAVELVCHHCGGNCPIADEDHDESAYELGEALTGETCGIYTAFLFCRGFVDRLYVDGGS